MDRKEVKELRAEELARNAHEKAEQFLAERNHDAQKGWLEFFKSHCGTGPANIGNGEGVYPIFEANHGILVDWINKNENGVVNLESLERAFIACKPRLIRYEKPSDADYKRHTDTLQSRISGQRLSSVLKFPDPPVPFSRMQLLDMAETKAGREKLKKVLKIYGNDAINAVLQSS